MVNVDDLWNGRLAFLLLYLPFGSAFGLWVMLGFTRIPVLVMYVCSNTRMYYFKAGL
jgi:hypothetical protein